MSKIKGKNTKPELLVRRFLFSRGFRFRVCDERMPGKPDIVLKKFNTVIFIHGCFWHGHYGCKFFRIPETRQQWWTEKINNTKTRDVENQELLIQSGWKVLIIWECELKKSNLHATLDILLDKLKTYQAI